MGLTPSGPDSMFPIDPIMIIGIVFFFGLILVAVVRGLMQWKRNEDSPVLTVSATVVAKRADVSNTYTQTGVNNSMTSSSSSTTYYVTFQVKSGDRMEFVVRDTEYGKLVEGDNGELTFQGTRYQDFDRQR